MELLDFFLDQPVMHERDARDFLLAQAADFYGAEANADAGALAEDICRLLSAPRFDWAESWRINRTIRSRYPDIFERVDALSRLGGSCMMPENEAWARRGFAFKGLCLLAKSGRSIGRRDRVESA